MEKHKITWKGSVHGDIEIEANSAQEAKEKLLAMSRSELVQSSKIWNSDQPVQIDCVDTQFGIFDEETWFEFAGN